MSKRKLLLADDSITIQKVVNLTFADEGIDVIAVGDGDSAFQKMSEERPDLVLADVNMPGLNGYQLCEKIKADSEFSKTPVVLLVGSFEPFDEEEAARVKADDHLTKPFQSIRQLVSKVSVLMNSTPSEVLASEEIPQAEAVEMVDSKSGFDTVADLPQTSPNVVEYAEDVADDETIETSRVGDFTDFEMQKFESKSYESEAVDYSETASDLNAETMEFPAEQSNEEALSDGSEMTGQVESSPVQAVQEPLLEIADGIEMPQSATVLDIDEQDPLELPPLEYPAAEAQTIKSADITSEEVDSAQSMTAHENRELSEDTINVIVQRVVERLSDGAIKEVAWEVVPQMAEAVIKQMAEEKLKS